MKPPSKLHQHVRFVLFLAWEFRWPAGVMIVLVFGGGLLVHTFYHREPVGYLEACYDVFLLIFLEAQLKFPEEWYLQPLFFLLPVVGLGAVADSVVRLGFLVFTQKRNLQEWQRMVASLHRNHIVVVGVGKVGYRIIKDLIAQHESVVAIERVAESEFLDQVHEWKVPVILGNARHRKILEQAGVAEARAIIVATDDDLANLDGALTAREINPKIRVVVRLFDDTLATKFAATFDMAALSASAVSAPAFVAAATGRTVYHDFQLDGQHLHLIDLTINPAGALVGQTVATVQTERHVNIVMHRGASGVRVNPGHDTILGGNDSLLVIAPMERLLELEAANRGRHLE